LDSSPISCKTLGSFFGVDGKRLEEQYLRHLSGFTCWEQAEHAANWLLFPENLGEYLSIDETSNYIRYLPIKLQKAEKEL
jgi:hypothetical protein